MSESPIADDDYRRDASSEPKGKTKKVYLCRICGEGFTLERFLCIHVYEQHSRAKPYVCPCCGLGFEVKWRFDKHKQIHDGEVLYDCDICGWKLASHDALEWHKKKVHEDRGYKCTSCTKIFVSARSLIEHRASVHKEETVEPDSVSRVRGYKCTSCTKIFVSARSLIDHRASVHKEETVEPDNVSRVLVAKMKNNNAVISEEQSVKPSQVETHNRSFSSNSKQLSTNCSSSTSLSQQSTDRNSQPHQNPFCKTSKVSPRVGTTSGATVAGLRTIFVTEASGKPSVHRKSALKCRVCGKCYWRNRLLSEHFVKAHPGSKPFACSMCCMEFDCMSHLSQHLMVHNPGEIHVCEFCGWRLASRKALELHVKDTHERLGYKCKFCQKIFLSLKARDEHISSVHIVIADVGAGSCPLNKAEGESCEISMLTDQSSCVDVLKSSKGHMWLAEKNSEGERGLGVSGDDSKMEGTVKAGDDKPNEDAGLLCTQELVEVKVEASDVEAAKGPDQPATKKRKIESVVDPPADRQATGRKTTVGNLTFYTCTACNRIFEQFPVLKRHLANHRKERKYHCKLCGRQFVHEAGLIKHTQAFHPGSFLYDCGYCGEQFMLKTAFWKHQLVTKHGIALEERRAKSSGDQVKQELSEVIKCRVCEQVFKSVIALEEHCRGEHKEEAGLVCKFCSSIFPQKKALEVHLLMCCLKKKVKKENKLRRPKKSEAEDISKVQRANRTSSRLNIMKASLATKRLCSDDTRGASRVAGKLVQGNADVMMKTYKLPAKMPVSEVHFESVKVEPSDELVESGGISSGEDTRLEQSVLLVGIGQSECENLVNQGGEVWTIKNEESADMDALELVPVKVESPDLTAGDGDSFLF